MHVLHTDINSFLNNKEQPEHSSFKLFTHKNNSNPYERFHIQHVWIFFFFMKFLCLELPTFDFSWMMRNSEIDFFGFQFSTLNLIWEVLITYFFNFWLSFIWDIFKGTSSSYGFTNWEIKIYHGSSNPSWRNHGVDFKEIRLPNFDKCF